MKIRVAALSTLVALAAAGGVLADVVKGPALTATGRVVSTGNASLVLETNDHGHMIPFMVGTTTEMPAGVAPGSRVTVHYHPIGTDQQMADQVVLLEQTRVASAALRPQSTSGAQPSAAPQPQQAPAPPAPAPPAPAQSPALSDSPSPTEDPAGEELPRTASPIPLVGLAGLAAFLASALVRRLERGL
jgi:hypothetical protein